MTGSQRIAWILLAASAAMAACNGPSDERNPASTGPAAAAVAQSPAQPASTVPPAQAVPPAPPASPAPPIQETPVAVAAAPSAVPATMPADALYICVSEVGGERKQRTIEYSPEVAKLCHKHPEMGPCQYERAACRRGGGRVFAANGSEITAATEAEYNRHVLRVQLRSD